MSEFNMDELKKALEEGTEEAKELLEDPSKIDGLLIELEEKLKDVPVAGAVLAKIPLMTAMIKAYITKEYDYVSPKVVISLISAFLYLIKKKDVIPDNIPVLGQIDDIAVLSGVLMLNEKELNDFSAWREANKKEA